MPETDSLSSVLIVSLKWVTTISLVQGGSNRDTKGPSAQDRKDPNNSKVTKFNIMGAVFNVFPLCAPSCEMALDEDEISVPWPNFPIVEPFSDDTFSGFLPELINQKSLASMEQTATSSASAPKLQQESTAKVLSSDTQLNKHKTSDNSPLMRSQHLFSRRGNSKITRDDAGHVKHMVLRNSVDSMGSKLHKCDAGQPSKSSAVMNFSHFSRFAPLSVVNLKNTTTTAGAVASRKQRSCNKSCLNPSEPTLAYSPDQKEGFPHAKQSEHLCGKDGVSDQPSDAAPTDVMVTDERIPEPVAATSSVFSANNIPDRTSNKPPCSFKRKYHKMEDSDGHSDEAEDKSFSDRKIASGCRSSMRSWVAEMHNLSERQRRRKKISENIKELQELIPNCNKIMSTVAGMYIPPIMFPAAIQNMHRVHMSKVLGMGIPDVNYSMTHMPNMQGPYYPVQASPNFRTSTFHSHQLPGQELLMSGLRVPPPLFASSSMSLPLRNVSAIPGIVDLPLFVPSAGSHEMLQNVNSQITNQNAQ